MYFMGFFVFVWFVLATSGNDENDFVDGKNAGINFGVMKKTPPYHHQVTPSSDGINFSFKPAIALYINKIIMQKVGVSDDGIRNAH